MHQKAIRGFEDATPYVCALVELDEQPMLLLATNLPGVAPSDVRIGQRVRVRFEPYADGLALPQFEPQ
jgi:uncharacterized OB-fold protein